MKKREFEVKNFLVGLAINIILFAIVVLTVLIFADPSFKFLELVARILVLGNGR